MSDDTGTRRKFHVYFTEEAWGMVESVVRDVNKDFEDGSISFSDAVNEMILSSKYDVKSIQAKYINVKRSLKRIASQNNVDLDSAIRALMELKTKASKRMQKSHTNQEEVI